SQTRRNYFRSGISFDQDFYLAFLEQEINGNAMLRSVNKGPVEFNEKNINHYMNYKYERRLPFFKKNYQDKEVYIFNTISAFQDREEERIVDLHNGDLNNGIRKVDNMDKEVQNLIKKSTYFLVDQVKADGKFEYGYFSAFAKRIGTYNIYVIQVHFTQWLRDVKY